MPRRVIRLPVFFVLAGALAGPGRAAEAGKGQDGTAAFELSSEEEAMLKLTNAERAKKDLPPLKPHPLLFKAARAHSKAMARTGKFSHVLNGKGPDARARKAGYEFTQIGENIFWGTNLTPKMALKGWMSSTGHRANILGKRYREVGLGVSEGEDGQKYYTQVFGARGSGE